MAGYRFNVTCPRDGTPLRHVAAGNTDGQHTRTLHPMPHLQRHLPDRRRPRRHITRPRPNPRRIRQPATRPPRTTQTRRHTTQTKDHNMNEPIIPLWIEAIIDTIGFALALTLMLIFFDDWRYVPIAAVGWGIGHYIVLCLRRSREATP